MINSLRWHSVLAIVGLLITGCSRDGTPVETSIVGPPTPVMACSDLQGASLPADAFSLPTGGAVISAAELKPGTGREEVTEANYVPPFCRIDGYIVPVDPEAPNMHFSVVIPAEWNGKAIHLGGNGFNGFIPRLASFIRGAAGSPMGPAYPPDLPYPVAMGYATFGSDGGHGEGRGRPPGWTPETPEDGAPPSQTPAALGAGAEGGPPPGLGFGWMANAEALENYSHAHVKKAYDAAMAVIGLLYDRKPDTTYFMGESQGGRDALIAAGVYGAYYDGVLVSVPLSYFSGLLLNSSYRLKLQLEPGAYVPRSKLPALENEVVAQCDRLDGLADGVILNYSACYQRFDVTQTNAPFANIRCPSGQDDGDHCFSDAQIGYLEKVFSPMDFGYPLRNGETSWPGNSIGGPGMGSGSLGFYLLPQAPDPANPTTNFTAVFDYILGGPGSFDYFGKTHAELREQIQHLSYVLDAPVDFTDLFAHGGKLILHSAANDHLTNTLSHIQIYQQAVARHGQQQVNANMRFYMTPNGDHGARGISADGEPQADSMDLITLLTHWVEDGVTPPDAVEQRYYQTKEPPYTVTKTRPLCRYPAYPHYNGSGDPNRMASYSCRVP